MEEEARLIPRRLDQSKKKRPGFRPLGKSRGNNNNNNNNHNNTNISSGDAAAKIATPSLQLTNKDHEENSGGVNTTSSVATAPTAAPASIVTAANTRKRKQATSVSFSLRSNNQLSTPATQQKDPSTRKRIITRSIVKGAEVAVKGSQDNTSTPARTTTRRSSALVIASKLTPGASIYVPPHDQQVLQRLTSENPDALRLMTFCSAFKVKKPPRPRNGTRTNAAQRAATNSNNKSSKNNASTLTSSKANNDSMTPDAMGAPVVKIVDGEIVLQESSLMVPGQRRTVQEVEEEFQDVVEEDAQLAIVGASYNSFVNRKGPQHWSIDETKKFFEILRQMGTDFCSMEAFFENRTRKQLKRKYRQELIRNPALVELALDPKNRTAVDLSIFDVEVDPKAIEEAAKDIPPPFIPTDMENTVGSEKAEENATPANGDAVAIAAAIAANTTQEVVEEDAEDEHQEAMTDANIQATFADREPSIWPTVYGKDDDMPDEEENNVDDFGIPEPSMDDFFHEQGEMVDPLVPGEEDAHVEDRPSTPPTPTALTLVPSKSNTKAKKPKFRTKSRKKK